MVLLPLLVNSILILVLNDSLSRAEHLIQSSRRQMIVVHKLSHALYVVTEILMGGNNALMNGAYSFFAPHISKGWEIFEKDLAAVEENITPDDAYNSFRDEMGNLLRRQKSIFIKSDDKSMVADSIFVKLRRVNEWVRIGSRQSRLLHTMQAVVREKFQRSIYLQQQEQKIIGGIVLLAIALNVFLALLLHRLFHRSFVGRIDSLSKMAQRLPSNEPLNEVISGSDELYEIGEELVKLSWNLADVSEYRRSLMQMMAHDVRSPLMAADISVATLNRVLKDTFSPQTENSLGNVGRALSSSLGLVNDLLLLEGLENGETKPELKVCNMREIVSSAVEDGEAFNKLPIETSVESVELKVDGRLLSLVIHRMLRSALDRAAKDGSVKITAAVSENQINLCVFDSGAPISPDARANLFDKVHQANRQDIEDLDSLGLAIAVPVVHLHHGSIGFEPSADGNRLCLKLPLNEDRR